MLYIGIDLGTTYSVAAYVKSNGIPEVISDYHDTRDYRTPSVVHISDEGCYVGTALEEILEDEPDLPHSRFFKLQMGLKQGVYTDHLGREWWPQSLSALILKKLIKDIDAYLHEDIAGAFIAVPANFNDAQRRATKEAAQLAGLHNVKLIEEPVAAATFYGQSNQGKDTTLFVYDLGGGTFDATVLQVTDDGLYALATEGSNTLGGKHVDELIMRFIEEDFQRQYGFTPSDESSQMKLRRFANEAKLKLAKPGKGRVNKTLVLGGKTIDFILTKERFDELIEAFVDETLSVCQRCLESAGMDWGFMDTVMMVGGSALLPLVAEKLSKACGKPKDQLLCKQPHQAVAFGAALLAEQQFTDAHGQSLQSICSYDLGIRVRDQQGNPAVQALVTRNTPVPACASTTFYTNRPDQTRLIIEAVQQREGDNGEMLDNSLGFFAFGIDTPRKNYPVEIELSYDLEGIVTVTARDPESGHEIRQIMDQEAQAMDNTLLEQQAWVAATNVNHA
ncbi:MAG: Hsp70 family protein [Cellvibrionaceae bacterium]